MSADTVPASTTSQNLVSYGIQVLPYDGRQELQRNVLELKKGDDAITYEIEQVDPSDDLQLQLDNNPPQIQKREIGTVDGFGGNDSVSWDVPLPLEHSQLTETVSWSDETIPWIEDDWETVDYRQELPVPHKCPKCGKFYLSVFNKKKITNWERVQLKCRVCSNPLQRCCELPPISSGAQNVSTNPTP